ncbi:MAG TPA: two-component sensor histidine kinase [Oxalobacteraceae bacterium]|nr:two-component sensor histidine kinase [Oxalobacteraceae bacterium]
MRLSRFINEHIDEILVEWESFAQTPGPAADGMSVLALRDHAKEILRTIALDIESWQNSQQQYEKSQGLEPEISGKPSAASIHGALLQACDFSLSQLSAEYRALRATVLRLWLPHVGQMSATTIYEMVRFNESIDQALAESVLTYSSRAEQARDLFLAILGHDLRAPLSALGMAGELLMRPAIAQDQVLPIGVRVTRSTRLMSSMVDDLLGYSQTQTGERMPISLHPANMRTICQSAIENARITYPDCEFSLETQGDLGGSLDAVRLHQLFANLLSNAAQYGTKECPIKIDARGDTDAITVEVTNHGPAIPDASLQAIFTPLVRLARADADGARPTTSLGLGLFVAREIVVAHGGTIVVKSSTNEVTTFTIRLPRQH